MTLVRISRLLGRSGLFSEVATIGSASRVSTGSSVAAVSASVNGFDGVIFEEIFGKESLVGTARSTITSRSMRGSMRGSIRASILGSMRGSIFDSILGSTLASILGSKRDRTSTTGVFSTSRISLDSLGKARLPRRRKLLRS